MVTTRNGSGSSSNQHRGVENVPENPTSQPPPPPAEGPSWAQMMANQAQLINLLSQSIANTQSVQAAAAAQPQVPAPLPPRAKFMRLHPPTFSSSTEPMGADDWLRTVGRKLEMVQCSDHERVLFASHQLCRPASEWWDNFSQSHANVQTITWDEFV